MIQAPQIQHNPPAIQRDRGATSAPGVQSLVLPLTFYRFAVAGSGSLETFLCPGLSQHIGTGTCLVLVHAEVALGALHHMKGLGTRGYSEFQGLPASRPGMGKD